MGVNIIVCCNGSWNTPDAMEGGLPGPTNVVKLYNALAAADAGGAEQKFYYHPSVGTDGTWVKRFLGRSTGKGRREAAPPSSGPPLPLIRTAVSARF